MSRRRISALASHPVGAVIELLRRAAEADRAAIVTDAREIGYPELVILAESLAAQLASSGIRRCGVVDHDAIDVIALFAAASLAGCEICLYAPLLTPAEIAATATRLGHEYVVTDDQDLVCGSDVTVITIDELARDSGGDVPTGLPAERPLLILTTGTTGEPKAARHDWSRLLRPYRDTASEPTERWLLAYGLHQFGGLQVVMHVMAAGATLVAPAPRRPREGLAAMRRFDVDHVSATPTYWRFVLAEMNADGGPVPELRQITLGGEAVPAQVLADLERTFPRSRISQVYAANEAGSMRSVRDGRNGMPASALGDRPDADVSLKIVDGELWVRSRTGMLGYLGDEPCDPDAWRATGDLVNIVGDRVLFRGRTTEIINVGGVKVHPLPIEELISAVSGVEVVRVYGRPNPVTGAIVAVEVVARPGVGRDDLDDAIRAACASLVPAAQPRSIRFVDEIATTGNKLSRGQR